MILKHGLISMDCSATTMIAGELCWMKLYYTFFVDGKCVNYWLVLFGIMNYDFSSEIFFLECIRPQKSYPIYCLKFLEDGSIIFL